MRRSHSPVPFLPIGLAGERGGLVGEDILFG